MRKDTVTIPVTLTRDQFRKLSNLATTDGMSEGAFTNWAVSDLLNQIKAATPSILDIEDKRRRAAWGSQFPR